MYSIHYKDSVVRTMTGRGQDKEVLEKLVVTDMVYHILNREVYTFHTSSRTSSPTSAPTSSPTSGPTSGPTGPTSRTHQWTDE
jgi:hypothetical protein